MIDLLNTFSIEQILISIALIAMAIKGIVDYIKWVKTKNKEKFDEEYEKKQKDEILSKYEETNADLQKRMANCYSSIEGKIDKLSSNINTRMNGMEEQLKILTDSDMHDIKSWIVEKHHHYKNLGWIDDFAMDTIEKRYLDYKKEGGNSYVDTLMEELRQLPKDPF